MLLWFATPQGIAALKYTASALVGIMGAVAIDEHVIQPMKNESSETDSEVEGLTEGLDSEKDSRGRDKKGNYVKPGGSASDDLDGLAGESDGKGGKILPDGSRAGIHTSTGTAGGKKGTNAGSDALHINRPTGKQYVKIRYPEEKD